MIIVFGTYLWPKTQRVSDRAYCSICERECRPLTSYSAWEVAHLMFIPLIPWGRVRVVCYCMTCQNCYRFSLNGRKLKAAIDARRREAFARVGRGINNTLNDVEALTHMGDFEGVQSLLDALDSQGGASRALAEARFLSLQGNAQEAESHFRQALEANPSSGTPDFWLGHFLLMQERDEEAVEQLQRAVQLNPDYEYFSLLQEFSQTRKYRKNWHGLAVLMGEMVRRHPDVTADRKFAKLYAKACRKSGRIGETTNPYADA